MKRLLIYTRKTDRDPLCPVTSGWSIWRRGIAAFALLPIVLICAASLLSAATPARGDARLSDSEIEAAIKVKLAKSKIGKDGMTVKVKNGIATWQGTTSVMQHKGAATRMAKTAGAIQVVNNIKISDEAKQKAAGNLTGKPRKVEVKTN
jgi:osmotically-inducible protein OsmY